MTKNFLIAIGVYGIIAIAVGIIDLTRNLNEEGLTTYDAFRDGILTGLGWPLSVIVWLT
jgi:hypothetical protein